VTAYFSENQDPDVSVRGNVVALDARTGARRWKTFTVPPNRDGATVWSTPAVDTATGRLYVGTGNAYHAPAHETTDSIMALDARDGRILDFFQATPDDVWNRTTNIAAGPDHDFGASPNLITSPSGRKLVGEGQKSGTYWALDRATLEPVWHTNVGPGGQTGGIVGGTAFDSERVYGPNTPGGLIWALGFDGESSWTSADGDALHFAPVSVANGVLYTQTFTATMTARNAENGMPIKSYPLDGPALGGVSIADAPCSPSAAPSRTAPGRSTPSGRPRRERRRSERRAGPHRVPSPVPVRRARPRACASRCVRAACGRGSVCASASR
jgi:polyvinyl alcohol dehydrogenase (cytochrome)